jgi:glyoxylase-like metal-dependent hydrolase (beta-lactamase superfamily II)
MVWPHCSSDIGAGLFATAHLLPPGPSESQHLQGAPFASRHVGFTPTRTVFSYLGTSDIGFAHVVFAPNAHRTMERPRFSRVYIMRNAKAEELIIREGGPVPRCFTVICVAAALLVARQSFGHPPPEKIQVADGIFLFRTAPYGDVGLDGNSVVILASDGVLVFDANGTPAAAAAVLAEIRKMTDQPVKYLVISHWHWDHWYGAEVYKQAFPDIKIVAQESERPMMMGPALDFNKPCIEVQLPGYIATLEKKIAEGEAANPNPANLPRLKQLLEDDKFFLEQKRSVHHTFPNLTYKNQVNIYMGEREIQVLHYDRAVTPGDSFIYLPK